MIAMAMSCVPLLLIDDEPATALDVNVQAQVLDRLNQLRSQSDTTLIIITHNLGLVARYADSVKIMYGGKNVESGNPDQIFENPHYPYTLGLIRSVPRLDLPRSHGLHTIQGEPPDMSTIPVDSCAFYARCRYASDVGESGSGKTTVGRCVIRDYTPTSGQVLYRGRDLTKADKREMRGLRPQIPMLVFEISILKKREHIA